MRCLYKKSDFKVSFAFILIFFFLLIFLFSYCDSSEKPLLINKILGQYNKERSKQNSLEEQIKHHLKKGEELSSVYHFTLAGQMLIVSGDIKKGIKVLNKAAAIDYSADAPHYLLARAYYQLAIYDMFRKGSYKINVVSRTDVSLVELCDGYIGIDIKEFVALEGRPASYGRALALKGFDMDERMKVMFYWLFLTKNKGIPDAQEAVEQAMKDFGLPKGLPVPTFWPDKETLQILKLAKDEMMLGERGKEIQSPPGVTVIEKDKMKSLLKRINQLLQEQGKKVVKSDTAPVEKLIAKLNHPNEAIRKQAMHSLASMGENAVIPLASALIHRDYSVRCSAVTILSEIGSPKALELILSARQDANVEVRRNVADTLGKFADKKAILALIEFLGDYDLTVRGLAQNRLGDIGEPAVDDLIKTMESENPALRGGALVPFYLEKIKNKRAVSAIISLLRNESLYFIKNKSKGDGSSEINARIIAVACKTLGKFGNVAAPELKRAIKEEKFLYAQAMLELALDMTQGQK